MTYGSLFSGIGGMDLDLPHEDEPYCDMDEFEDYEPDFDCSMDSDGNCGAAGSEDCEFECPYNKH